MLPRLAVVCLALALVQAGCHRRPSGPDANYEEASRLYQQLFATELDDAYGDPRMDQVEAQLKKVDPNSVDAPSAKTMLDAIRAGRETLAKQRADREKLGREVAKSVQSAPAFVPSSNFAPSREAANGDPFGDGASVAQINKDNGGCLVPNEPFGETGTGMKGTIYRLATSSQCASKLPGFVGQAVLVINGNIYRRMPDFAKGAGPSADGGAQVPGAGPAAGAPGDAGVAPGGPRTAAGAPGAPAPQPAPAQPAGGYAAPAAPAPAPAPSDSAGTTPGFQPPAPPPPPTESAPEPAR